MSMSGAPALASYRLALQSPTPGADQAIGLEQRLAHASLRRIEAKEFVFAEGDPATHLYQVETGAVALYKVLCDGRRQVLGFAYPGDLIFVPVDATRGEFWAKIRDISSALGPAAVLGAAVAQ